MVTGRPLVVDLDGTLIRTDLLYESVCKLFRESPASLCLIPYWLCRGKARLKQQLAARTPVDPGALPFNRDFVGWLKQERAQGRTLILCTASDHAAATAVAQHLGVFDEVMASNGTGGSLLIDCLTLAMLYTLRIIAGAAVARIDLSFWLLAFSCFLFLSLAFAKRYAELRLLSDNGQRQASGRAYYVSDSPVIQMLGITSGYAAVLVMALYLNSDTVLQLYRTPQVLWAAIPITVFWISWMWMQAHRGQLNEDAASIDVHRARSALSVSPSPLPMAAALGPARLAVGPRALLSRHAASAQRRQ